jgi:hypothetical protein
MHGLEDVVNSVHFFATNIDSIVSVYSRKKKERETSNCQGRPRIVRGNKKKKKKKKMLVGQNRTSARRRDCARANGAGSAHGGDKFGVPRRPRGCKRLQRVYVGLIGLAGELGGGGSERGFFFFFFFLLLNTSSSRALTARPRATCRRGPSRASRRRIRVGARRLPRCSPHSSRR